MYGLKRTRYYWNEGWFWNRRRTPTTAKKLPTLSSKNDNAIIKKIKTGLVLNFKKNEVFTEVVRPRKKTQDIEIEVWTYEKNKFTQQFSNKKIEEKS